MNSFVLVYQDIVLFRSFNQPIYTYILFVTHHLTLTMPCHGNGKQRKTKTATTE